MAKLNPQAKPFIPAAVAMHDSGDDERSLFMTFSNGSPLNNDEVSKYFNSLYGKCVDHVYVHDLLSGDPKFGKIIFTTSFMPNYILCNREVVKVLVNRKPVWLKEYVPRSQRNKQD